MGNHKIAKLLAEDFCKSNGIKDNETIDSLSKLLEHISLAVTMRSYKRYYNAAPNSMNYEKPRGLDFFEDIKKDIECLNK